MTGGSAVGPTMRVLTNRSSVGHCVRSASPTLAAWYMNSSSFPCQPAKLPAAASVPSDMET